MLFYRRIKEKDLDPSIKFIPHTYRLKNINIVDNIFSCPICGKNPKIYKKIDSMGWTHYKIQCKGSFRSIKRPHLLVKYSDRSEADSFRSCMHKWNDSCLNYYLLYSFIF